MPSNSSVPDTSAFDRWIAALESRHLAALRMPEVTRALRALSSAYVERRHAVRAGATLDGAGKRAAFALFYAPLHYLATAQVVRALGATSATTSAVLDLGCGTGAAGAAWALAAGRVPVHGIDRHPWAVAEASWTYRELGLAGRARVGDVTKPHPIRPGTSIIAAYVLNELAPDARQRLTDALIEAVRRDQDSRVLILEPIARAVTPWWDDTARRFQAAGGRADEWTLTLDLPPLVAQLDRASGMRHREFKLRTLFLARAGAEGTGS